MKPSLPLRNFLLAAGSSLLAISSTNAADGTWNTDLAGNWTDITKWLGGADYAFGTDSTATFGNVITADRIITLDSLVTIGNITASDTSNNYTISGANTITLDRTTGVPIINVTQSGRTLTINSQISGSDGLLKSGAGDLILGGSNNFTGGLYISAGRIVYQSTTGANVWGDAANVITFTGNATLHNNDGAYTLARGINVNGFTATLTGAFGESTNVTGAVTGTGTLNVTGASNGWAVTLSNAANTFTGAVGVFGGAGTASLSVASLGSSANAITLGTGNNGPGTFTYTGSTALSRSLALGGTTAGGTFNSSGSGVITINSNLSIANNGAKTLTLGGSNTGANTFAGSIGDSGAGATAITKADAGTWILSNASNSYAGATTISAGTLVVSTLANGGSNSNIGASSNAAGNLILNGGTLSYWGAAVSTDRLFSLQAGSTINSSGSGAINFTNTGSIGFNGGTAAKTLTLTGTNTGDNTIAAVIGNNTGATSLTKSGMGKWVLSGSNTWTGTTTFSGGGTMVLDYSTNDNRKLPTGALSLAAGTIILKGGTATETASSTTFNNGTNGTFFVRDGGTAKINLNAFTVGTGSTVSFSHDSMATTDRLNTIGILGSWFTVGNRWATNAGVNGAGGSAGAGAAADGDIVGYTGGATFTNALATDNNTNADLTGSLTLSGPKTVNTLRIVSDADNQVLNIGANILSTSNLTGNGTSTSGGILYAGGANGNYTIQGTTGGLRIFNQNGQGQLINVYSGTLTVDATIGSGSSPLVKSGEGTLVVNKALSTGAVRVYQGVLRLTGAGTLIAGSSVQNGAAIELGNSVAIANTATLNITGTGVSNGGVLRSVATTTSSYAAAITLGGDSRINSDSGTLTLSGGVVTNGNTVTFGGAGNTTVSTAAISGSGGLIKDGAGKTTLSFAHTYTGATSVTNGVLNIQNATALGTTAGSTSVRSGAALEIQGGITVGAESLTLNGTGISLNDGALRNISGTNNYGGLVTLGSASRINSDAGTLNLTGGITTAGHTVTFGGLGNIAISTGAITGAGGITKDFAGALTLSTTNTYTGDTNLINGILQLDGSTHASSTVNVSTAGTLTGTGTVNGNATLTGNGAINKASGTIGGTLGVTGGNWNGNGAVTGLITSSSGIFTIGNGANLTADGNLDVTGGTLAAGNSSSTITGSLNYSSASSSIFAGVIAGAGKTLTLNNNSAVLTLFGDNTYTGATNVNAGKLLIHGSTSADSAFTVNNGATLGGRGTIGGSVTLMSGAILSPGASIESLATGSNTWNGGSTVQVEFSTDGSTGAAETEWDLINITGTLDLTGASSSSPITLDLVSMLNDTDAGLLAVWDENENATWAGFVTTTGGITDFAANKFVFTTLNFLNTLNGTFNVSQEGNNLNLNYVTNYAIPEPKAALLGGLGLLLLLRRRRA